MSRNFDVSLINVVRVIDADAAHSRVIATESRLPRDSSLLFADAFNTTIELFPRKKHSTYPDRLHLANATSDRRATTKRNFLVAVRGLLALFDFQGHEEISARQTPRMAVPRVRCF